MHVHINSPAFRDSPSRSRSRIERVRRHQALLDIAAQQAVWWLTVLAVGAGHATWAFVPALVLVVGSLAGGRARTETCILVAFAGCAGFTLDSLLVGFGIIGFPSDTSALWSPGWMVGLWCAFGLAFRTSLRRLSRLSSWYVVPIGGVMGAIAYRAGMAVGVIEIAPWFMSLYVIAAGWAMAVVALSGLTRLLYDNPGEPNHGSA